MASHKAAFDAGEVERLVILVVVILGAEVFIPVAGHILLEESHKVFEEFEAVLSQFIAELATGDDDAPVVVVAHTLAVLPEADIDIQTSLVNTDADTILVPHSTARISVTISLAKVEIEVTNQVIVICFVLVHSLKVFNLSQSESTLALWLLFLLYILLCQHLLFGICGRGCCIYSRLDCTGSWNEYCNTNSCYCSYFEYYCQNGG